MSTETKPHDGLRLAQTLPGARTTGAAASGGLRPAPAKALRSGRLGAAPFGRAHLGAAPWEARAAGAAGSEGVGVK